MGEEDTTLTDEEIEALLDEEDEEESTASATGGGAGRVKLDHEVLRSVYEPIYESLENVLSTILNRDVTQEIDELDVVDQDFLRSRTQEAGGDLLLVETEVEGAVEGVARYVLPEADALRLADVMMGQEGDDPPDEFDEVYESAIVEMYNQVVNTLANQISEVTGETLDLTAPESEVISGDEFANRLENEDFFWVASNVSVEELIDQSTFMEIQPVELAELLVASQETEETPPEPEPEAGAQPRAGAEAEPSPQPEAGGDQAEVKSVNFPQFEATESESGEGNLNMLMDVPMEVAVELGRTKLQVKEILNLGQGSIIELDRLAGEPVDLLVNGRLVARGEVVVIDESFGVRVTSIVSPMDRIK